MVHQFLLSIIQLEVFDGKVHLFVTNEANDPFQLHIKDIVGTTTLWEFQYIAPTKSL